MRAASPLAPLIAALLLIAIPIRHVAVERVAWQPPMEGTADDLAVVATDATLDKAGCGRLATMGHDGLARAVDRGVLFVARHDQISGFRRLVRHRLLPHVMHLLP